MPIEWIRVEERKAWVEPSSLHGLEPGIPPRDSFQIIIFGVNVMGTYLLIS